MRAFILTLFAALLLTWLTSGERFLDAVFEMVDLGGVDDIIIEIVVLFEQYKETLGLPDIFSATRETLHRMLGLN